MAAEKPQPKAVPTLMSSGPDITPPEMPLAFDEQGLAVAVSHPIFETSDDEHQTGADYGSFLDLLTVGAADAEQVGRRVIFLRYIMQSPDQRGTLADVARLLGISKQAAHKRLTRFRADLPAISKESGFSG